MKVLDNYIIPFAGLEEGTHHFDFKMDDAFWGAFEDSGIKGGDADVNVSVVRSRRMLELSVSIEGNVVVECDRCLDDLRLPVDYEGELTVKFSEEGDDYYDGEVMWLNPTEGRVNIAQYLYESVLLSLPYRRIHGEDDNPGECNPEMLARFGIISQEEFDRLEEQEDVETLGERPEGEALRKLKEKLEKQ